MCIRDSFCSAPACRMPESYREIRYNLQSIAFDPEKRSFGQKIDTLYNANKEGRSAKFPRVSPDGRFLMYTVSDYGNFSIWHKDADLRLLDMLTCQTDSLLQVNSDDVESLSLIHISFTNPKTGNKASNRLYPRGAISCKSR